MANENQNTATTATGTGATVEATAQPKVTAAVKAFADNEVEGTNLFMALVDITAHVGAQKYGDDTKKVRRMLELSRLEAFNLGKATEEARGRFLLKDKFEVSRIMALVYPKTPEAAAGLKLAREYNDALPKGIRTRESIGRDFILSIARGDLDAKAVIDGKGEGLSKKEIEEKARITAKKEDGRSANGAKAGETAGASSTAAGSDAGAVQAAAGGQTAGTVAPAPQAASMVPKDRFEAGFRLLVRSYRDKEGVPFDVIGEISRKVLSEEAPKG